VSSIDTQHARGTRIAKIYCNSAEPKKTLLRTEEVAPRRSEQQLEQRDDRVAERVEVRVGRLRSSGEDRVNEKLCAPSSKVTETLLGSRR
jgi:hypothetical protein